MQRKHIFDDIEASALLQLAKKSKTTLNYLQPSTSKSEERDTKEIAVFLYLNLGTPWVWLSYKIYSIPRLHCKMLRIKTSVKCMNVHSLLNKPEVPHRPAPGCWRRSCSLNNETSCCGGTAPVWWLPCVWGGPESDPLGKLWMKEFSISIKWEFK